jgi:hypothetical protein
VPAFALRATLTGATALFTLLLPCAAAAQDNVDPLLASFQVPPRDSRPVSHASGNEKAVGRVFSELYSEAPGRLKYMSREWKEAFRNAVKQADALGIRTVINTSPGWSHTGGPSVKPPEAMKKLVWSTTQVRGGDTFKGKLSPPPAVTGPFQDLENVPASTQSFYADSAVIAYRATAHIQQPVPVSVMSNAGPINAALLSDGELHEKFSLPYVGGKAWVQITYDRPQTIRTAVIGTPSPLRNGQDGRSTAVQLQAQDENGIWRSVATTEFADVPQVTLSFKPVTARVFRVRLSAFSLALDILKRSTAPGADTSLWDMAFDPPQSFPLSELSLQSAARVNEFERKAGFGVLADYYAHATPHVAASIAVPVSDVVNLTGRMAADGTLNWAPPPGNWIVLRFGYSLIGKTNHPAPPEATGLEVDKLSRRYVRRYMETYLDQYSETLPHSLMGAHGLQGVFSDSTEAGWQNWTDDMFAEFRRLRGYDPGPYMPALTGVIVNSAEASDKFLWDFRRTVAQLVAENQYGEVAAVVHERGLFFQAEGIESGQLQLGDDIEMRRYADVPTGAMWTFPPDEGPNAALVGDLRGAASAAHLYGKTIVGAESFTSISAPSAFSPRDLKPMADLMFALGVNQLLWAGVDHDDTWAEQAAPWISYLSRTSYLLQQGRFVADVAYFYGEDLYATALTRLGRLNDVPQSYAYDFVSAEAIVNLLTFKDGCISTPSGMCYRTLQLGGTSAHMTLPVLRKIKALVKDGAVVVGARPFDSPSLADDAPEFQHIAAELWGPDGYGQQLGRGRVYGKGTVDEILAARGIDPDVTFTHSHQDTRLMFVHRTLPDGDVYFISNRKNRLEKIDATFRVAGRMPELWRSEDGTSTPLSFDAKKGRMTVPLTLNPFESIFVIFRKPTDMASRVVPKLASHVLGEVKGPWTLSFQPGRGAPGNISVATLSAWNKSRIHGIKYFSGTATYTTTVYAPRTWFEAGTRIMLDLGDVKELAEVAVNGAPGGILWNAPYSADVTSTLQPGENNITVKVTNLGVNRLIGDKQPGAAKHTPGPEYESIYSGTYRSDAPLRSSGLLGPVLIRQIRTSE